MKSTNPVVSITVPVYNCERYISECLESVLKQDYKIWRYCIPTYGEDRLEGERGSFFKGKVSGTEV